MKDIKIKDAAYFSKQEKQNTELRRNGKSKTRFYRRRHDLRRCKMTVKQIKQEAEKEYGKTTYPLTHKELFINGAVYGAKLTSGGWHDLRKNPDDLPQDVKLNEFESYNPLVLIFFYRYDDYGKAAKVYALDRWNGEPFNYWESFRKDKVIAWHELPYFEG